jgi:hypothetical protein
MKECNINKKSLVDEHSVRLANCYDSCAEKEINFPKTPGNDLILTSLYEAMLKTNEIGLQNQQKLLVKKTASFKKKGKSKRGKSKKGNSKKRKGAGKTGSQSKSKGDATTIKRTLHEPH